MRQLDFAELRDQLQASLAHLAGVAEAGSHASGRQARELAKKLADERFVVVVAGEFKRGKSTLINALLGEEVLPTAVVPLTSIVTAVTWGSEPRAEVRFADGRIDQIDARDLSRFVTERENPENRLGVDRVLVLHPSPFLRDGISLVDTPGVGSVFQHNTDAALAFLPEADAAIFVTTVDPPISFGERSFLDSIRTEAARMFFVLNKIDYLGGRDLEEALAFTEHVLAESLGAATKVYPVSARQGLEAKRTGDGALLRASGLVELEREFHDFLLHQKGWTMIASVATSARGLGAAQRNSLHVEQRALELSVEDLRARLEQMEQLFADALRSRDEVVALLSGAVDRIMAGIDEQLAGFQRREVPRLSAAANRFLGEASDLRAAATSIDAFVAEQVRAAVDPYRREQEQRVGRAFADAASRFVDQIDDLTRRTVRLTGDLLGVRLEEIAPPTEISSVSRFNYQFTEVPTLLESLLPDPKRYLPKGWSRSLALKRVGERIPELIDRHCGRMRGDLLHRLRESRRLLERDLTGRLEATIEGLRRGAERAADDRARTEPEVRASRDRLREALGVLDGIDAALDGVVAAAKAGMDGQPAHA